MWQEHWTFLVCYISLSTTWLWNLHGDWVNVGTWLIWFAKQPLQIPADVARLLAPTTQSCNVLYGARHHWFWNPKLAQYILEVKVCIICFPLDICRWHMPPMPIVWWCGTDGLSPAQNHQWFAILVPSHHLLLFVCFGTSGTSGSSGACLLCLCQTWFINALVKLQMLYQTL